jgi:hypothetical protein
MLIGSDQPLVEHRSRRDEGRTHEGAAFEVLA